MQKSVVATTKNDRALGEGGGGGESWRDGQVKIPHREGMDSARAASGS